MHSSQLLMARISPIRMSTIFTTRRKKKICVCYQNEAKTFCLKKLLLIYLPNENYSLKGFNVLFFC